MITCCLLYAAAGAVLLGGCLPKPVSTLVDQTSFTLREKEPADEMFHSIDELSREEAVRIALKNNPTYLEAGQSITAARMRLYQALGGYSPVISAATAVGDQLYDSSGAPELESGNAFYSYTMVQASFLIFDGLAREFQVEAARHSLAGEEALQENARRLLTQAVSNAFDDILLAAAQRKIADSDFEFQSKMLEDSRLREKAGTANRSGVLNFAGKRNRAAARRVTASYQYEVGRYVLAVLLGYPDGTLPEGLKFTQEKPDEAAPLPVDAALDAALANRPDLKNFREQLRVSEYQLYSRYSAFSPRISAFANYSYSSNSTRNSGNNPNGFANFYVEGNSFNYGAMAELTIFNGLIRYNRLRESRAQLAIMQYKGAEAWLRIVADVRNAHANVQHNRELAALNRENRDIMREQRDLVAKSYLAGEAEITRLNEAQNNFVAAEEEYVQSLVNLSKARAQLAAAVGGVHSIQ